MASADGPLLACCLCKHLIREAVQLTCLHNCCRQCFNISSTKSSYMVECASCGFITKAGCELPNRFIDYQVRCYTLITEPDVCGICTVKGEHDKWCLTCGHSLCEGCVAEHKEINGQHATQGIEELRSYGELRSLFSSSACPIHNKPLTVACLNCGQSKCSSCWAACKEYKHTMHMVGDESFESYMSKLVDCISKMEDELLQKLGVLEKPNSILRDLKVACDRHLADMEQRKRCIVDAVEYVYQKMKIATRNAYDNLKAECDAAASAAHRIESDQNDARNYIHRLIESSEKCEIFNQQQNIRERLRFLSHELDNLSDRLATTTGEVKLKTSLPDDLEDVVRTWIGTPQGFLAALPSPPSGQTQQCFTFSAPSATVPLPVHCEDIAVTTDGRSLLLAADKHGLIEIGCWSKRQLSHWVPAKDGSLKDEEVQAVIALNDGRAAVSLRFAQCVALLRRREKNLFTGEASGSSCQGHVAAGDKDWTVDRRLYQLPWPPRWLSSHGDVLAVSEFYHGTRLQLLSLCRERPLRAELRLEYGIGSLAVTAHAVICGSRSPVELGGGIRAQVLEAYGLANGSDEHLWRYALNSSDGDETEELRGVCADSRGGCLYAAVCRSDLSCSRVSALSLATGDELQCIVLSFEPTELLRPQPLRPMRLALSDGSAASEKHKPSSKSRMLLLAALCVDPKTNDCTAVTVHVSDC